MLVVAQSADCARDALRSLGRNDVTQLAYLDDALCVGPTELASLRRDRAWRHFARQRHDYWRRIANEAPGQPAQWPLVGPRAVRQSSRIVVAVHRDANGWMLLSLLLSLCRHELPPSRWLVHWREPSQQSGVVPGCARHITPDEYRDASRLWLAATSQTPEELGRIEPTSPIALTAQRILSQLPDDVSGLTLVERSLLDACASGARKVRNVVGRALVALSDVESVLPPQYLHARLCRLASERAQAVQLTSGEANAWDSAVSITDFGDDLIAGRANLIRSLGTEEVVGGVRQSSASGAIWVRTGDGKVVRRPV